MSLVSRSSNFPLYQSVTVSPSFRITHLADTESGPINLSNVVRTLFSLTNDSYEVRTNCIRLSEIAFLGLGDLHNFDPIRKINNSVADFFVQPGNDILTECGPSKYVSMLDIKKGIQELGWDTGKEWMQEVADDFGNLLAAIQRFKYMVKFDNQHLFHKQNRAKESFFKVSDLFDKIIKSYSKKDLNDYFRDRLINKKNPDQAKYQKLCSHNLERTENPDIIFFKCKAVLEIALMKLNDFYKDDFQSRQFSLIKNSIKSIKKNQIAIVVAGTDHFVKNNKLEFNVEKYFSSQKVPHLILTPILLSYVQERALEKVSELTSDIPENIDFSVRSKRPYTFAGLTKMLFTRYQKLATLVENHYRSDGSMIPSDHPKHKTPGPHPKGPIQYNAK